jgi:RNA polymerase sigma factor (sigma-70 family)
MVDRIALLVGERRSAAPGDDIAGLVARAAGRDDRAWHQLVARFAPVVDAALRQVDLPPADREDAGQLAWMRAFQRLDRLHDPEKLAPWLATIARRAALELARKRQRGRDVAFDDDLHEQLQGDQDYEASEPEASVLAGERRAAVREALATLPVARRELMAEVFAAAPRPYAEIADVLRVRVGCIGPTRGRCLDQLARCPCIRKLE